MSFKGFSPEALELLAELPTYDRDAFQAASATYKSQILEPSKTFVAALGPALADSISPRIRYGPKTNESISPINNDLRFNPDGARYKDFLLFRFWEGSERRLSPTMYVRVGAGEVGFGVGMPFAKDHLDTIREAIDSDGDRLEAAIGKLVRYQNAEIVGQELKRVPSPYPEDHRHAGLLRHKMLQVRWLADPKDTISKAAFVTFCRNQLQKAEAVHHWLVNHAA